MSLLLVYAQGQDLDAHAMVLEVGPHLQFESTLS